MFIIVVIVMVWIVIGWVVLKLYIDDCRYFYDLFGRLRVDIIKRCLFFYFIFWDCLMGNDVLL